MKVPYVCWDVDKVMNCNFIRPDSLSKDTFVFTTYQEDVAKFQYAGANAYYLPPISNIKENTTGELKKEMPETFLNEISFVGSSLFYENNDFLLFERNVRDLMCRGNSEVEKEGRVLLSTLQRALDRQAPFTRRNEYKLREILVEELNGIYPLRFFTFNHQQLHNVLAKECCKMQRITYL
ncbi:MAG: hypothetical protein ACE5FU_13055, partial [Nitrospinota bacterium]